MAASVSTDIEVTEFAGQLFFRLWHASHTRTAEKLHLIGLTPALFALLNVLGGRNGAIQQQLSSDMGIDPSAMVKLINELESAGLANRRRRPGDRRAWGVSISAKGRRTLERARQFVAQVEDEGLGGLTGADRRQLLMLLRRALVSAPPQPPWRPEEGS
jgi:DNA-binding MarR family transcriptional regulator